MWCWIHSSLQLVSVTGFSQPTIFGKKFTTQLTLSMVALNWSDKLRRNRTESSSSLIFKAASQTCFKLSTCQHKTNIKCHKLRVRVSLHPVSSSRLLHKLASNYQPVNTKPISNVINSGLGLVFIQSHLQGCFTNLLQIINLSTQNQYQMS